MKKLFVCCIALMLMLLPTGMSLAETVLIYGSVINTQPLPIVCAADGTIEQINISVGDRIAKGDIVATVETQKVYAPANGTVYLFGQPGDKVSEVVEQYGAVAYVAPSQPYTVSATAKDRNGMAVSVIPGETVYLRCYKDGKHTGKGILGKLEKDKYTVVVTEGEFVTNETVSIYRDAAYTEVSRIGRAKVTTAGMIACKGDGYLVNYHVKNGAKVEKGAILYETISGNFTPSSPVQANVLAPADGIISSIYDKTGSELSGASPAAEQPAVKTGEEKKDEQSVSTSNAAAPVSNHVVAELYPDATLRIVAYAPESILHDIHVGDTVYVSCQYIENMAAPVAGTVEKISRIPAPENLGVEAQYAVYVTVADASLFYYGMNVIVSTGDGN